jgi:hypothetical protein
VTIVVSEEAGERVPEVDDAGRDDRDHQQDADDVDRHRPETSSTSEATVTAAT